MIAALASPGVTSPPAAAPPANAATAAPPPTAAGDPDATYRDLLARLREEREQLAHIVEHPF